MNPRHLGTWTFQYWLGHLGTRYWIFRYWPGHLGTRYWTVRDLELDETIFGTDHNCLVLINCQYFCTSSSLIYDPKVDRYVFDNSGVDRSRKWLFLYIDFYLYFHYFDLQLLSLYRLLKSNKRLKLWSMIKEIKFCN